MRHGIVRRYSFTFVALVISALLFVAAIFVFVFKHLSGAGGCAGSEEYNVTEVACDFEKFDIGDVSSDTIVTLNYTMKNVGEDSLHVLFVSPDCNCTGFRLSRQSAGIGDSIILSLDVDMKNKRKGIFMLNTVVGLNTKQRLYRISVEGNVL